MLKAVRHGLLIAFLAAIAVTTSRAAIAQSQRPPAVRLFPKNTVAFLSVADASDFGARLSRTAMGQMLRDPQMRPLVDELYGLLGNAFAPAQERVGLSLSELLAIPQGEFAIGVVARENQQPALLALLDAKGQGQQVQKMIEAADRMLQEDAGALSHEETVDDVKLTVYELPGQGQEEGRQPAWFERDGTYVIGSVELVKQVLAVWNGGEEETLAQNQNFAAIQSRSASANGEPPQLSWFIDPIELVRSAGSGNASARIGLAVLPTLGLDGLLGLGGTIAMATDEFDTVMHMHVLLDNPRSGVVELAALKSGDTTPESWVPNDATSYLTLHWDFEKTYTKLARLVDSFQAAGAFRSAVAMRITDPTGIDLEKDVLPLLTGRVSLAVLVERPVTIFSQGSLFGVQLADPVKAQELLNKLATKFPDGLLRKSYGGATYFEFGFSLPSGPTEVDRPPPCVGIVGDYLLATDRPNFFQRAVVTASGTESLSEALDYKLISSKITRLPGGDKPGLLSFARPEEGMRFIYDLASSTDTRQQFGRLAPENEFFKNVNKALEDNPLPPFSVLEQYLAPGGSLLTDDDTGFHYVSFTLARKVAK